MPRKNSSSKLANLTSSNPKLIAVLGAGAWGTTLASVASANGHHVKVWSRSGTVSLADTVKDADIILSAVSMKGVSEVALQLQPLSIPENAVFVTATKGLDPQTACTPSQIWQQTFPTHSIVVLSGPNLSPEIDQKLPSATVVASHSATAAEFVQVFFSSRHFRVYTNLDPIGVELGGTLKNVIAIASGSCDGLQLGTNAKAALVTRGLAEMVRVGVSWGAKAETFYGLSGLGDLLATCNSPLSRNYQVGYQLASGKTLSQILVHLKVTAEGVNTCVVLVKRSQQENISTPITQQVYRVLQGEISPRKALEELMERNIKPEYND
jgi:glycerol-3-phosphate dehydrogenase (NAD(P)+)